MVAQHLRRPAAGAPDLVDVQRRGVRREDAVRTRHAGDFGKGGLLQIEVLEHRLDDDVDLIEPVIAGRRRNQRQRPFDLGRRRHPRG